MDMTTGSKAQLLAQQAHFIEQPQVQQRTHVPLYQLSTQTSPNPLRPTIEGIRESAKRLLHRRYNLPEEKLIPEPLPKLGWNHSNKRGFFLGIIDHGFREHLIELHYYLSNRNEFIRQQIFSSPTETLRPNHTPTFIDRMYDFYIHPFYKGSKVYAISSENDTNVSSKSRRERFISNLMNRDDCCLFCWYPYKNQGAHIVAKKTSTIVGNQSVALARAGMTDINDVQNGLFLCTRCHNEFDILRRYVDVVDSVSGRVVQSADQCLDRLRYVFLSDQLHNEVWVCLNGELQKVRLDSVTPLDAGDEDEWAAAEGLADEQPMANDGHTQGGTLQATLFNLEDALRSVAHDGATSFNSVDEYAGKKLVLRVTDYTGFPGKDREDYSFVIGSLEDNRNSCRRLEKYRDRQAFNSDGDMDLYFVDNDPAKLPKLAALMYHKAACLLMRMAGGAEPIDDDFSDDEDDPITCLVDDRIDDSTQVPEEKINPESIDRVMNWFKTVDPLKRAEESANHPDYRNNSGNRTQS